MPSKKPVGNAQLMQKINRLQVLNYIRRNGPVARPAVAQATGLSLSSITNIVNYLLEQRIVAETGVESLGRVGRKATLLRFNGRAYRLICIYIEAEQLTVCLTDLSGMVYDRAVLSYPPAQNDSRFLLQSIKDAIELILTKNGGELVLGIGIAVSGLVLDNSNYILSASLRWKAYHVKDELEQLFHKPVFIQNISITRAVWQISQEKGARERNVIFLDLDNGIGAVQFFDGELNRSLIGEIGHTTIDKSGVACFCGNHGCLEAMCSTDRIVQLYHKARPECSQATYNDVVAAAAAQEKAAIDAICECGEYLGIGLANVVNIFHPDKIIINSGAYANCELIFETATKTMEQRAYAALTKGLVIERVSLNRDDSCRGISVHLCDSIFQNVFPL